jgi:hypothetical protein
MRLIPRRKRTWALVLLGVAIVTSVSLWLEATSYKSDFEREYDRLKIGMTIPETLAVMAHSSTLASLSLDDGPWPYLRCGVTDEGEHITLVFENDLLTEKEFRPLGARYRLRRLWTRCFKSSPPF